MRYLKQKRNLSFLQENGKSAFFMGFQDLNVGSCSKTHSTQDKKRITALAFKALEKI